MNCIEYVPSIPRIAVELNVFPFVGFIANVDARAFPVKPPIAPGLTPKPAIAPKAPATLPNKVLAKAFPIFDATVIAVG